MPDTRRRTGGQGWRGRRGESSQGKTRPALRHPVHRLPDARNLRRRGRFRFGARGWKDPAVGRKRSPGLRFHAQRCAHHCDLNRHKLPPITRHSVMLTAHELIGFMSPKLAAEILEHAHSSEKEVYKATLAAVAQARKVRPVFLERQPRVEQHNAIIATLSRPSMDLAAAGLLRC